MLFASFSLSLFLCQPPYGVSLFLFQSMHLSAYYSFYQSLCRSVSGFLSLCASQVSTDLEIALDVALSESKSLAIKICGTPADTAALQEISARIQKAIQAAAEHRAHVEDGNNEPAAQESPNWFRAEPAAAEEAAVEEVPAAQASPNWFRGGFNCI